MLVRNSTFQALPLHMSNLQTSSSIRTPGRVSKEVEGILRSEAAKAKETALFLARKRAMFYAMLDGERATR